MPIFEISCAGCGHSGELLVMSSADQLVCPQCGGDRGGKNDFRAQRPNRQPEASPSPARGTIAAADPALDRPDAPVRAPAAAKPRS